MECDIKCPDNACEAIDCPKCINSCKDPVCITKCEVIKKKIGPTNKMSSRLQLTNL